MIFLLYHEKWDLKKPTVNGPNGVVSSQHYLASEVGAYILQSGGNAVDAAIATSFAVSVVEPWMSGVGGGGYMQVAFASEPTNCRTFHFGMRAPTGINPDFYPLVRGNQSSGDLFSWPSVLENRNIIGYHSIAVPGQVAGLARAHSRYATMPWKELLQPAIDLAKRGLPITWNMSLRCLSAAQELKLFSESRNIYLDDHDLPLQPIQGQNMPLSPLGKLPMTLERLAEAGADDFYHGDIAQMIIADLQDGESSMDKADLSDYHSFETSSLRIPYNNIIVHAAPQMTAGPTLARAIDLSKGLGTGGEVSPGAKVYAGWASSLETAYKERLETMGDGCGINDCTTHISIADKNGNLVSLTQTLLSVFGSRVTLPKTGILMNNGIYWFNPVPGQPNSLAPNKRALSNMCPVIVEKDRKPYFAIGASGGRRIMPAVFQLISMIGVFEMDLNTAAHQPRIDVSGEGRCTVDPELGPEVIAAIKERMPIFEGENSVIPTLFACPNVALVDPQNGCVGFAHPMTPTAVTIAA